MNDSLLEKKRGHGFVQHSVRKKCVCKVHFFHEGGSHHIETSPLILRVNQWTRFYIIRASVVK